MSIVESKILNAMNYPAASYGVSNTARNEASFGEYYPESLKSGLKFPKETAMVRPKKRPQPRMKLTNSYRRLYLHLAYFNTIGFTSF